MKRQYEAMEDRKLKEQVELIRQVFGYIQRFSAQTIVIKIDCPLMEHPFFPMLVKDLVLLHRQGIRIVLVPGAKQRIDEVLGRYDIGWEAVDGIRISTAEAIPFIKMAAFDVSNHLMTQLAENNTNAIIGNWVRARSLGVLKGVDYKNTGTIESINVELVRKALDEQLVPIFPNIGWSSSGKPYNISSSELAYTLATTLAAAKLFYIVKHRGIAAADYRLPEGVSVSDDGAVTHLTVDQAKQLIELNTNRTEDEMVQLLGLARRACSEGVTRVHIVNGEIEGVILKELFSSRGCGTMIYTNQHENIRQMRKADIPEVLRIMQPFVEREILLPRTEEDLALQCDDFVVYDVDGIIHASAALHPAKQDKQRGEIAAIAVDQTYTGIGIGQRMLSFLVEKARMLKLKQLYVLTTQTTDWFVQFGFSEGGVDDLPQEKRKDYNRRRNSRVLLLDVNHFRQSA